MLLVNGDQPPLDDTVLEGMSVDQGAKLGVNGRGIAWCETQSVGEYGARVTFRIHGGGVLTFVSDGDTAFYEPEGLA